MPTITLTSSSASGKSHDFTTHFQNPLQFPGNGSYEIALFSASIWYSYYNISSSYNNNTFRYFNGSEYKTVSLPNGIYNIVDINNYLKTIMKENSDYDSDSDEDTFYLSILPNYESGTCEVKLSNGYKLDLTYGNFANLIGYDKIELTDAKNTNTKAVDITNGVNSVHIHVDIVDTSIVNGYSYSDVIYSFIPTVGPFELMYISPNQYVFTELRRNTINKIRVYITDQNGNILNLNDNETTIQLIIQENSNQLLREQNALLTDIKSALTK
mgnify:CR=1 FL=1